MYILRLKKQFSLNPQILNIDLLNTIYITDETIIYGYNSQTTSWCSTKFWKVGGSFISHLAMTEIF